jgi:hypothetical protein
VKPLTVAIDTTLDGVVHAHVIADADPQGKPVRDSVERLALMGPYQIAVERMTLEDIRKRHSYERFQQDTMDPMLREHTDLPLQAPAD